ncbi:MAG: phosphoglycerate dehydrogenase [Dethiobacteria bacterium]|jgi:D-3-phosphoglycerate dehydrogenase|nr:phosphoglycerate dehydrogenase [Bacillota bacterium]
MKVLISDPLSSEGIDYLRQNVETADVRTDLSAEELLAIIGEYDALVVRSGTKVTAEVIEAGNKLKVIGRAGVGVDNIDVEKATEKGIVVINAPEGNTISAAEHALAMLASLARNIPRAHYSLKNREWKRSSFMGVELYKKTLGIVGLGRIGSEVAKRARSFGMNILAYDPYISSERARKLGVKLEEEPEEIYRQADFITLHIPKTSSTYHMIDAEQLAMMKDGVRIVNCARGGLINEEALYEALQSGKVAGAALDVFEDEPPLDSKLLDLENVIVTPHLGASTREAQINVALQVAEQVVHALRGEPVVSAVNVPVIMPETMAEVEPFLPLMRLLGSFYMQTFNGKVKEVEIIYSGEIANYQVNPLTNSFLIGLLSVTLNEHVNYVNAPVIVRNRGIKIKEITTKNCENFTNLVTVNVKTAAGVITVAGTLFNQKDMRIVQIGDYRIEVTPSRYMFVCTYIDQPGVIGRVGTKLGENNINIAGMYVGRQSIGGEAVMVLQVDDIIPDELLSTLKELDSILKVYFVRFNL